MDNTRLCRSKRKVHFQALGRYKSNRSGCKRHSAPGLPVELFPEHALSKHQSERLIHAISKSVLKLEKGQDKKAGNSVEEKMTVAYSFFKSKILKYYIISS